MWNRCCSSWAAKSDTLPAQTQNFALSLCAIPSTHWLFIGCEVWHIACTNPKLCSVIVRNTIQALTVHWLWGLTHCLHKPKALLCHCEKYHPSIDCSLAVKSDTLPAQTQILPVTVCNTIHALTVHGLWSLTHCLHKPKALLCHCEKYHPSIDCSLAMRSDTLSAQTQSFALSLWAKCHLCIKNYLWTVKSDNEVLEKEREKKKRTKSKVSSERHADYQTERYLQVWEAGRRRCTGRWRVARGVPWQSPRVWSGQGWCQTCCPVLDLHKHRENAVVLDGAFHDKVSIICCILLNVLLPMTERLAPLPNTVPKQASVKVQIWTYIHLQTQRAPLHWKSKKPQNKQKPHPKATKPIKSSLSEWFLLYIAHKKPSTWNLVCSQCLMQTVHTHKPLQAKNYQRKK